jgi:hypothetical protein
LFPRGELTPGASRIYSCYSCASPPTGTAFLCCLLNFFDKMTLCSSLQGFYFTFVTLFLEAPFACVAIQ